MLPISASQNIGLETLKEEVFRSLEMIRIYTKAPGKKPVLDKPAVLKKGCTIDDFAADIHKDIRSKMKYAVVWGSGKHDGQRVGREYLPQDKDIVELHT